MIPIKCRRIQVGGGVLYFDAKGTVDLMCKDGSSIVLKNLLYVLKLGANVLSARRLYEAGLVGSFNSGTMYFKLNGETIIKAKIENGPYIVHHIAKHHKDMAFPSIDYDMSNSIDQLLPISESSKQTGWLNQSAKDRYLLFQQRYAHLRQKKISKLHTVPSVDQPIKVPEDLDICEVCAIAKMTNSIPKTRADHMVSKLALIQFDIAGPVPKSLNGNRYFILIVDCFTRNNWVLVLNKKSDAKRVLEEWKKAIELQANTKIKAARSDNAAELVQTIEQWRTSQGTDAQFTTIASSYQNRPAKCSIGTAEASMRAMLNYAGLQLESGDEAVTADIYLRNQTNTGPIIDGKRQLPLKELGPELLRQLITSVKLLYLL
jgi:hypothetical protein